MTRPILLALGLAFAAGPLCAQQPATTQPSNTYRSPITNALRIYTDLVIQAELKLTDEQKAKIARIPDDLLTKYKDQIAQEQAAQKEANDKATARAAEITKKLDAVLDKHLTAAQRKRFTQLVVQLQGMRAFSDPEVNRTLGLTDEQRAKLVEIQLAGLEKLRAEFPNLGGEAAPDEQRKRTEASRTMTREMITQFVGTFTTKQKTTWAEMVGEPNSAAVQSREFFGDRPLVPGALFTSGAPFALRATVLNTNAFRAELKLDAKADEALKAGCDEVVREAAQAAITPTGRPPTGQLLNTVSSEAGRTAAGVLTERQAKRLRQIQFQMDGLNVFGGGSLQVTGWNISQLYLGDLSQLHLTPVQVKKIEAVLAEAYRESSAVRPRLPVGPEADQKAQAEQNQKWAEIHQKGLADILATFDAGQRSEWHELTGEPIDVNKITARIIVYGGGNNRGMIANALAREASIKTTRGEYAAALAAYDEAIRLDPNRNFISGRAQLLATCPSDWVRDGKQALELMTKALAGKEPTYTELSVLAACHAEAGQFDEAVKAQEKAISLLPASPQANPNTGRPAFDITARLKPQYEARLKLYRDKKPYRLDPPQSRTEW